MIREIRRQRVLDWKKSHPCPCGEADIDCLDAHHLQPDSKEFSIAHISGRTIDAIDSELEKCVSLCCRCHRKFNAWLRSTGQSAIKENFQVWLEQVQPDRGEKQNEKATEENLKDMERQ